MRIFLLAIGFLSAALACTPAAATMIIAGDNGGLMESYVNRFREVRRTGDTVVIDGTCMSACTMVLGLLPRHRVCATPNAVLGFHAAWQYDNSGSRIASPSGTRELMRTYPPAIRAWIARQGGLKPTMMLLRGRDLAAVVPSCESAFAAEARPQHPRSARRSQTSDRRRASADAR